MNLGLLLPLPLPGGGYLLVLLAKLVNQVLQVDKLSWRLWTHNLEGSRGHHPLFLVGGWPGLPWLGGEHASTVHQKM